MEVIVLIPRFCPRRLCANHFQPVSKRGWYRSAGSYETKAFGTVARFVCVDCGKYFSSQTFSIDYYGKRTVSYRRLFGHVITTSSARDMARDFNVTVDVIQNKLSRLSRNCLAVMQRLRRNVVLDEDLVADGFESFTVSQFFPCHFNLLAGKESQFVYWYEYVTVRRKGRMTNKQKIQRDFVELFFRADKKGLEKSFLELFQDVSRLICDGKRRIVTCFTDKHSAYRRAQKNCLSIFGLVGQSRLRHIRIDSTLPRTVSNPLFSVNYLDRQIRKDMSEHVRETVCFGRNVNSAIDRMSIYLVYHNVYKQYRESQGDIRSHAEVAGIQGRMIEKIKYGLFSRRMFVSHACLDQIHSRMWFRKFVTPLKRRSEYLPKHAAD